MNKLTAALLVFCCGIGISASAQVFSNKGKEFWVGYGHNYFFSVPASDAQFNTQDMVLYLSADQPATVTVSINGTDWKKTYTIPANTVISTETIPKNGVYDARILKEGEFDRAVHIESDVPIVAYAHVYGNTSSGAAMLLPVDTYAYTYYSLNSEQHYGVGDCHLWFFVVANEDNTTVQITPAANTTGGQKAGVPFTVTLNRGQLYNVMGYDENSDLSGSKVQSIEGTDGKCHPIGVFSGSSRTNICDPDLFGGGGDFIIQQMFPASAWGTQYLTARTSTSDDPTVHNTNKFRVYVRDIKTVVRRNGKLLTGLTNKSYYEYVGTTDDYITADQPIMVAQFIPSSTGCGTTGLGDPEMFCLSPLEQAINKVDFYSTNKEAIQVNYLTLIIPQAGLASLKIDGSNTFDQSYAHPNLPGYQIIVKKLPTTPMQHTVQSDTGFTAITYGEGQYETYGYNAGTYVKNLNVIPQIHNDALDVDSVCSKTPFSLSILTVYQATSITWHLSAVTNISPNQDVLVSNPTSEGTTVVNGKTYYKYSLTGTYKLTAPGNFSIPVSITADVIDNCSHTDITNIDIPVKQGPSVDFSFQDACAGAVLTFQGQTPDVAAIQSWRWDFGDKSPVVNTRDTKKIYSTGGTFDIMLQVVRTSDGCYGDTTKQINIHPLPYVQFTLPAVVCLPAGLATFTNKTGIAGADISTLQYAWLFGDGPATVADKNPTHAYTAAGTYAVQLKVTSADGCIDSLTQTLSNFDNRPTAHIGITDSTLCLGTAAGLNDNSIAGSSAIDTWRWTLGDGNTATSKNVNQQYTAPGNYTVQLYVVDSKGCLSDTATHSVNVSATPQVSAGPDLTTAPNTPVTLQGQVSDPSFTVRWTPDVNLSNPAILTPVAQPKATQQYILTATGQNSCTASDTMLVRIFTDIHVPNAFTPNNDGINDQWQIPGLQSFHDATVEVYNRWGQIVFRSQGYSTPWNGTRNGQPLPAGAYMYIINPNQKGYDRQTGSVLILR